MNYCIEVFMDGIIACIIWLNSDAWVTAALTKPLQFSGVASVLIAICITIMRA
jgi:hypothetical protein